MSKTENDSSLLCPKCEMPMEIVHLIGGGAGIVVLEGNPPDGPVGRLLEAFTAKLVRSENGYPVLSGPKEGHKYPATHCRNCKAITIRYRF
jgi:hypothetical protein